MNDSYNIISKSTGLLSLDSVKLYLRVDTDDEDDLIEALIQSAIDTAEKFMNRDILTTVWVNKRDNLYQDLTLRRGGFQSVSGIEYMVDGVYTLLDEDEYQIANGMYGKVYSINVPEYDEHPEAIKITFSTGFGASGDVPSAIITAIKAHVAFLYENRGDCEGEMPCICRTIYGNYRIIDINGVV